MEINFFLKIFEDFCLKYSKYSNLGKELKKCLESKNEFGIFFDIKQ